MITKTVGVRSKKQYQNGILYLSIALFAVLFTVLKPSFFSFSNLNAVLQSMASLTVLGIGATFILTVGEIDISNGAMMSIAPCTIALLIVKGWPSFLSVLIGILMVLSLGLLNGILTARIGIPSFISTLGVQGIAMGLTRTLTANRPVLLDNEKLLWVFGGKIGPVSNDVIWMFILLVVGWFILSKTRFGRSLHCIGDNSEAATQYGINVRRYKIGTFLITSGFIFFAGMMESLRSSYMRPGFGESLTLYSIVVALIGGSSVRGGQSNIFGTFVGALFVTIVRNGLFMMAMSSFMQNILIGLVIIFVLTINAVLENRERELKRT